MENANGQRWTLLYIAIYPQYNRRIGVAMATAKTTTLTFRIEPNLKDAVRTAADREHRSIANMIEVMIRDYCGRVGVTILDMHEPSAQGGAKPISRKQKDLK